MVIATRPVVALEAAVRAALGDVSDPEIPGLSILDLGVVGDIDVSVERIRVELLPTFVGCPALEVMRQAVVERLAPFAARVETEVSFRIPWTTDRISAAGRAHLRALGFAPPPRIEGHASRTLPLLPLPIAECPFCGSRQTTLENAFGPTLCRAIYHCSDCRQPFEQFKTI